MVAKPLTVVQMLPELQSGGIERGVLEFGAFLSRNGHRSIVISGGGRLVERLKQQGSQHLTLQVYKKNPLTLASILPLRRFLLREKVDVLHLRSRVPAWVGYLAWLSIPKRKRPLLITTFHGFYSINVYSAVMTKGERVIAISKVIANHIRDNYKVAEKKLLTIHRGVDIESFDPRKVSRERLKKLQEEWHLTPENGPVIMLPGRISPWKGHDILIKALINLKDLEWQVVFIGDTAENPRITSELKGMLAQHKLSDRVHFVGYCDDMAAAYLLADLVVSAASTEPEAFGRVAVEAAAMAKPVIASAHGGSLETVLDGKTGWLVKPNDHQSMENALHEALQDPQLRKSLGSSGKTWVRDNFTIAKMCADTIALYQKTLKGKRQ